MSDMGSRCTPFLGGSVLVMFSPYAEHHPDGGPWAPCEPCHQGEHMSCDGLGCRCRFCWEA